MGKMNLLESLMKQGNFQLVVWNETYATKIEIIDNQHMELINLTNALFKACMSGKEKANAAFREAMSRMVEYVQFHFSTEEKLLTRINYPGFQEHKKQHEIMVFNILQAVKDFNEGGIFVPNHFARTLKDWIFSHIAVSDKSFAIFIHERRKKGLLTDEQLKI